MGRETSNPRRPIVEDPLGFWSMDVGTGISTLDASMSACFGLSEEEGARGIPCWTMLERIPASDHALVFSKTQEAIDRRGYLAFSYGIRQEKGGIRPVRTLGRCFTDSAGEPTHVAGILVDAASAAPVPVHVQIVEHLMAARDLSQAVDDGVLCRLIEAVLLQAGCSLARTADGWTVDES